MFDICSCCKVCGKVYRQKCGGIWGLVGTCEKGLVCVSDKKPHKPVHFEIGVCGEYKASYGFESKDKRNQRFLYSVNCDDLLFHFLIFYI